MIITLSEKRNERLVFEWAEEMTEQHAQDFCDVCNAVFTDDYTVPYILERFGMNIYGAGFIMVVYKDDKPLATLSGLRNDIDGKAAIQLEHMASLPQVRKNGYALDMIYCMFDEIGKRYPNAFIFGYPTDQARDVDVAAGFVKADLYRRVFCGATEDFLQNMPYIDDNYAEAFTLKKKAAVIMTVKGKCYACFEFKLGGIIPAGVIVGEVSPKFKGTVPDAGKLRVYTYCSTKPGILGRTHYYRLTAYQLGAAVQDAEHMPPYYKCSHNSVDFFSAQY